MNGSGVIFPEETRHDSDPNPGQRNPPGIRQSRHLGQRDRSRRRHNVTVEQRYKDAEGRWKTTDSLGQDDLLAAAKVLDLGTHSWICLEAKGPESPIDSISAD